MLLPIFTVGHSNRTIEAFVELLLAERIELVVDVRRLPGSRRYPQFDEDALRPSLASEGIDLARNTALTGRRPVSHDVPFETNALWRNRSFHNYADHALSEEFREGLADLRQEGHSQRVAVMCSEAVWWRCHRRIIADHLLARGEQVIHVIGAGRSQSAELTPGALSDEVLGVVYPESAPSRGE
ncbi:DUF488 family protein [Microbacterium sp. AK031]|uniref:DUF488 domain-containing protein n=1 Tax=Microbacterium sp. AK031 TaxID=2723076 RepID=UPI002167C474|nr:DUF488 domain-containing protein [Microbacterium sp. AK031]MCS3842282.1 uncharacterized protein (DUF488 family) [Microbacterium sp. AK031]